MQLNQNILKNKVVILLFKLTFGLAILFTYHHFSKVPLIASVDVNKIIAEFIEVNKHSIQDEMQVVIKSNKFMQTLEQTMNKYAADNNKSLIVSSAVIVGIEDVTKIIQVQVKEKLNG